MTSTYVAGNLPKLHACVARPRRRAAAPCEQGIRSRHPARDPPLVLLVNIGVWAIIDGSVSDANDRAQTLEGLQWSGAAFYPFVYAMVIGITSISATFPLALAYSVTRRHFAVGSAITYAMLSAFFAAIFTVLALIETATGGWGFGGRMFIAVYFGDGAAWQRFLLVAAAFLFFFTIGTLFGTIYARWRASASWCPSGAPAVLLLGLGYLATVTDSWPAVGAWLAANGAAGVVAWSLVPTALAAAIGYTLASQGHPELHLTRGRRASPGRSAAARGRQRRSPRARRRRRARRASRAAARPVRAWPRPTRRAAARRPAPT